MKNFSWHSIEEYQETHFYDVSWFIFIFLFSVIDATSTTKNKISVIRIEFIRIEIVTMCVWTTLKCSLYKKILASFYEKEINVKRMRKKTSIKCVNHLSLIVVKMEMWMTITSANNFFLMFFWKWQSIVQETIENIPNRWK